VGAGFGLLSSMLSSEGFEVDALEPDVEPIYLKGLTVHIFKDHLEDYVKKTKVKYDAVILYDVLEHVDSPKDTVKLFENLLNDKGIVIIQTPNYESLMAKVVRNWSWWMVEDHRFFFSKKSLDLLFNNRSWKQLFYRTYEEWPDFKKNLDGNFVMIQNALVRKCIKALFFGFFAPFYVVGKHQLWKCGRGGLHMAIWQYNKR
jgi:2-polyprenyl-3-methyl-5-hydroxy-6-metoxy-1,4-benzoquinol methylase